MERPRYWDDVHTNLHALLSRVMHHMSCVMCHLSYVLCHVSCVIFHVSHVTCHMQLNLFNLVFIFFIIFSDNVVKLVSGGSVITRAYHVQSIQLCSSSFICQFEQPCCVCGGHVISVNLQGYFRGAKSRFKRYGGTHILFQIFHQIYEEKNICDTTSLGKALISITVLI